MKIQLNTGRPYCFQGIWKAITLKSSWDWSFTTYRPISLTGCACKVMGAHGKLCWGVEIFQIYSVDINTVHPLLIIWWTWNTTFRILLSHTKNLAFLSLIWRKHVTPCDVMIPSSLVESKELSPNLYIFLPTQYLHVHLGSVSCACHPKESRV
jgi:hypothetical protein